MNVTYDKKYGKNVKLWEVSYGIKSRNSGKKLNAR